MVYIFPPNGSHNNKVHAIHFCKIKFKRIVIKRSAVRVKFTHVWRWWMLTSEDWKRKFSFRHEEGNNLQHQISVRQSCPWSEGVRGHSGNGLWQRHATVPQKARKQNILKGQVPYLATCTAVLHSVLWKEDLECKHEAIWITKESIANATGASLSSPSSTNTAMASSASTSTASSPLHHPAHPTHLSHPAT